MLSSFNYNYKTLHIYKFFQLIHLNLSSLKTKTNKQIHVSFEKGSTETGPALSDPSPISSRHPCFSLPSQEALTALQERIYEHHIKGVPASAQECDKPGGENSGSKVSLVSLPSSVSLHVSHSTRHSKRLGVGLIPFFFPFTSKGRRVPNPVLC